MMMACKSICRNAIAVSYPYFQYQKYRQQTQPVGNFTAFGNLTFFSGIRQLFLGSRLCLLSAHPFCSEELQIIFQDHIIPPIKDTTIFFIS